MAEATPQPALRKFTVFVATGHTEVWTVLVEDAEEAEANYEDGELRTSTWWTPSSRRWKKQRRKSGTRGFLKRVPCASLARAPMA